MTPSAATIYRRRWWTLGVLSLNASASQLQWITDVYLLVFAGVLLTAGSLGDRFGRKKALLAGLVLFGSGSLFSAFSGSPELLVLGRGVMGLGGAFIMPSTLSVLTNVFPARERARAISIWAGVSGLGIAIGPITGGFLLDHFWWGSVFLVNVPIVIVALLAAKPLVPESSDPKTPPVDTLGAALSIASLVSLVWAIIEAQSRGWSSSPILAGFAAFAGLGAAFVAWELRTPHPMLQMTFFRNRAFSGASAAISLVFFALMGTIYFLTQYIQLVKGYSPLAAGVRIAPVALGLMLGAGMSPKLNGRFGTKVMVPAGLTIVAGALTLLAQANVDTGYGLVAAVLVLMGLGMGTAMAPATDSVMGSLPLEKASIGSAMNDTTRQVGGALGVAVLGSLLTTGYRDHLDPHVPAQARDSLGAALHVPSTHVVDGAQQAFVAGMSTTALVAAAIALVGALVAAIALPKRSRYRVSTAQVTCISCGTEIAPSLAHLGSLHCHDCRDAQPLTAAKLEVAAA
ncbi:MAG: MFS transporter [Actinobacteria bacterium]|nr:MAG: MFS transporter [Actinomycetota bacterium]